MCDVVVFEKSSDAILRVYFPRDVTEEEKCEHCRLTRMLTSFVKNGTATI